MSDTARSPLSGCAILIAAVVMLVFLIGFSMWVPFRQAAEIEKFTGETPQPLAVEAVEGNEAAVEALRERFAGFAEALKDEKQEVRLELSAEDLNLAIAVFPAMSELREAMRVKEIGEEGLVIEINYQLNGRPRLTREDEEGVLTSDPRYLVGTITGHPVLSRREMVLSVDRLEVPGAEVAEGFMGHFSTLRLFEKSVEDPEIGPAMATLTATGIEDGRLFVARIPGAPLPDVVTDESFQRSGAKIAKFLGAAAVLFLLVAGTVVFLGYRRQLRQLVADEETNRPDPDA